MKTSINFSPAGPTLYCRRRHWTISTLSCRGAATTRQESAHRLFGGDGQIIATGRHGLLQADRSRTQAEYRVDTPLVQGFETATDATSDGNTGYAERAGTFNPCGIAEALEGYEFDGLGNGPTLYRAADHQCFKDVLVMKGAENPGNEYEALEIVEVTPRAQVEYAPDHPMFAGGELGQCNPGA